MVGRLTRQLVRAVRYAAYAAAGLVVLAVLAALLAPRFLDTPAVERELQAKLSELAEGTVAWEKLSIRLLPSPRGSLSGVRAEIRGAASLRAEQVDAHLRLLPLLRGRAEVASVSLVKPVVRVRVSPSAPAKKEAEERLAGPVEGYRAAVSAIHRFARGAVIDVEDGQVDVGLPEIPQIRLRHLELHGRSDGRRMEVELTAASEAWSRLKITASADFADLSGAAKVDLAGLKPQEWLDHFLGSSPVGVAVPDASLHIDARSDGRTRLEADFDLRAATVEVLRAAERVPVSDFALSGQVATSGEELAVRLTGAQLGASRLAEGSVSYALKSRSLSTSADFDLDLAQAMDATRRLVPGEAAEALARIQAVAGRAQGRAKFDLQRSGWRAAVDIRKADASVGVEGLPGPAKLAAGAVSVTRDAVRIERAEVALLDARALASGTIAYGKPLRIEGAVSEGSVGEELLAWVWKAAGAPPHLAPKAPVRVAVERASWSPDRPLDIAATAAFDAGPAVAVELGWTPGALDIRRATIKDAKSDAAVALHLEKRLLQGRFTGTLQSASIGAMLKDGNAPSGGWSGDLRARVDLDHPERFSAAGKLAGRSVDLAWLLERPVTIDRVDLQADGERLQVRQASVIWAKQRFALRGEVARAADGAPIVDAQVESPGVVVDALLQRTKPRPSPAGEKKAKPEDGPLWTEWPLPVRGRIALRSKYIQYGERKAEPVVATLTLEQRRALLELEQVELCGISFPLTAEAAPDDVFALSVKLESKKQQLEQTARCLTEHGVQITGEFDLRADLRTNGKPRELVRNLAGSVEAEARDGRVTKFALLGNILSTQTVASMFKERGPKVDEKGFPYRSLTAKGHFDAGAFVIDESFFRSDVIGIAASGSISLTGGDDRPYDTGLTVLVAPLGRLDELMRKVPVLGYVIGGTLTSVPVRVSGDIRDPRVVPLGPKAVGSELAGVMERALKLPEHVLPMGSGPAAK